MPITELTETDKNFIKILAEKGASEEQAFKSWTKWRGAQKVPDVLQNSPAGGVLTNIMQKKAAGVPTEFEKEESFAKSSPFVAAARERNQAAVPGAQSIRNKEETIKRFTGEIAPETGVSGSMADLPVIGKGIERHRELKQSREDAMNEIDGALERSAAKFDAKLKAPIREVVFGLGLPAVEVVNELASLAMNTPFVPAGLPTDEGLKIFASPNEIIETFIKAAPEPLKESVKEKVATAVGGFNTFYEGLSPIQQQNLKETGAVFEIVTSLIGAEALAKTGAAKALGKSGVNLGENVISKVDNVAEKVLKAESNFKQRLLNKSNDKQLSKISTMVDELLAKDASLQKRVVEFTEKRNTDIGDQLKDPQIFKGIGVDKNGKVTIDGALSTISNRVNSAKISKDKILKEADRIASKTPKSELRDSAISFLKKDNLPPAEELKAIKKIDEQLKALPDDMTLTQLDELRAKFRSAATNAKGLQKEGSQFTALMEASRDIVFNKIDNLPVNTSGEYAALSGFMKNQLDTQDFLKTILRGQTVKAGNLTKRLNKTTGAIIGSTQGLAGAVLGSEVADVLTKVMFSKQLNGALKKQFIEGMLADNPAAIKEALRLIDDIAEFDFPQLGAPTGEFRQQVGSGETIVLPKRSPSTIEAEEAIVRDVSNFTKGLTKKPANK